MSSCPGAAEWPAGLQFEPFGRRDGRVPQRDRRIMLTVQSLRFLTPDVAVADCTAEFSAGEPTRDRATYVLVRRGGAWQVAALRVMEAEAS